MDLLGSIMDAMDKPPSLTDNEKAIIKKRKEEVERQQAEEKEKIRKFKNGAEESIRKFFDNPTNTCMKFKPMEYIYRSIVHEIAECMGYLTYAFGTEGIDRYVRIYRKENAPSEDEIAARKRGEAWNDQIKQELEGRRNQELLDAELRRTRKPEKFVPNTNYKDKYVHLIGQDSALEAAKKTETNKTYGFVPSENKKDIRSIEQTMADLRAKKKIKLSHDAEDKS